MIESDFSLVIINSKNGQTERILSGHTNYIKDVIILPNNKIASRSDDKTIKIWNPNTGICDVTITHNNEILDFAIYKQSEPISIVSVDKNNLYITNTNTGELLYKNENLQIKDFVLPLANGMIVLGTTYSQGNIIILNPMIDQIIPIQFNDIKLQTFTSKISFSDNSFIIGSNKGRIFNILMDNSGAVYNGSSFYLRSTIILKGSITEISNLSDEKIIVTSSDGTVTIINKRDLKQVNNFLTERYPSVIVISENQMVLKIWGKIEVWNPQKLFSDKQPDSIINTMKYGEFEKVIKLSNGKIALLGMDDKTDKIFLNIWK